MIKIETYRETLIYNKQQKARAEELFRDGALNYFLRCLDMLVLSGQRYVQVADIMPCINENKELLTSIIFSLNSKGFLETIDIKGDIREEMVVITDLFVNRLQWPEEREASKNAINIDNYELQALVDDPSGIYVIVSNYLQFNRSTLLLDLFNSYMDYDQEQVIHDCLVLANNGFFLLDYTLAYPIPAIVLSAA